MHSYSVRRRTLLTAGLASAAILGACEDKRVKELKTGITRDSAVSVISHDAKPNGLKTDTFPNVYTREEYLIAGKRYDVLYFTPDNDKAKVLPYGQRPHTKADSIPYARLTPLVFVDNLLIGRGWPFWDSVSKTKNIPLKPR